MKLHHLAAVLVLGTGCIDLSLPPAPPPPRPGTIQGRLLVAVPGRSLGLPAARGRVAVQNSSNSIATDSEGRFVLGGIVDSELTLILSADVDGDGAMERQRLLPLMNRVGPDRDLALGDVVLGASARVVGTVRLADAPTPSTGNLGITVFVTGLEFVTFSADNGSFALDALPEGGPMQIAFFKAGYAADSREVTLAPGEERRLAEIVLRPEVARPAVVTGLVRSVSGPLDQARVRAVGWAHSGEGLTGADGRFSIDLPGPGPWVMAAERDGYSSAYLGRRLMLAGDNDLGEIVLAEGASTRLDLDAGVVPTNRDGGLDAGPGPADGGADAGIDGRVDGGADAGLDGGVDGGLDAGTALTCEGACAAGFACTSFVECQTTACGLQSCAGACHDGRCFLPSCGATSCGVGEVCDGTVCKPLACAGITCPPSSSCANGRCVSVLCRNGSCAPGSVCVASTCTDVRCVDVNCGANETCISGTCIPLASSTVTCAPGFVFLGGRCVDFACQTLVCPSGSICRAGQCTPTGVFVAGVAFPNGNQSLAPEVVIARLVGNTWRRVNVTTLPRVLQLSHSPGGEWLYALTDDSTDLNKEGSLWRSADGVGWTRLFDGTDVGTSGALNTMAWDFTTGTLYVAINGGPQNLLSGALASSDLGATWSRVAFARQSAAGRDRTTGTSPAVSVVSRTSTSTSGLYPNDGGAPAPYGSAVDALILYDPLGQGPLFISAGDLRSFDGGAVVPITSTCQDCIVYGPGTNLFVTSGTGLWFTSNGTSWGTKTLPTTPTLSISGLVRTADDGLLIANFNARPPLLSSPDEGMTWSQLGTDWYLDPELSDSVEPWRPDASYAFQQRVRPRTPNGWIYERGPGPALSTRVEPAWPTDGGSVFEPGGPVWQTFAPHLPMRLTAMTSLRCSVGRLRCAGGCVDIGRDPTNCGACGVTCAGACVLGRCVADGGAQSGCADGTREGFADDVRWPDVAACAGRWTGDLSGSADALCGPGFHVCTHQDTELGQVTTTEALSFPGCFAYRASNDGFDGCEPLECTNSPQRDDMAGVGRGCLLISGVTHASTDAGSCLADRGRIDAQCCAGSMTIPGSSRTPGCRQRTEDGVACCRN